MGGNKVTAGSAKMKARMIERLTVATEDEEELDVSISMAEEGTSIAGPHYGDHNRSTHGIDDNERRNVSTLPLSRRQGNSNRCILMTDTRFSTMAELPRQHGHRSSMDDLPQLAPIATVASVATLEFATNGVVDVDDLVQTPLEEDTSDLESWEEEFPTDQDIKPQPISSDDTSDNFDSARDKYDNDSSSHSEDEPSAIDEAALRERMIRRGFTSAIVAVLSSWLFGRVVDFVSRRIMKSTDGLLDGAAQVTDDIAAVAQQTLL
jgi:hypothetical protein